jgi:hypothetical protein
VGAVEGIFWPKILWNFLAHDLDRVLKPFPALQLLNLLSGITVVVWERPLNHNISIILFRSHKARLAIYPLFATASILLYQSGDAAVYYAIGVGLYAWSFHEREESTFLCLPQVVHTNRRIDYTVQNST